MTWHLTAVPCHAERVEQVHSPSPGDAIGNAVRGTVFCQPIVHFPFLYIACPLHTAGFVIRQESLEILCGGLLGGSLPFLKVPGQPGQATGVLQCGSLAAKWHLEIALQLPNIPVTQGPAA